ncbi:hypothetical protein [Pedobacter sp. KLB.chiD]|uniref:hypothetical protein n=1 Tax=Pedobacter sp. KLB.chiD TaxID=3387402 RepID=UPI00399BD8B4
MKKIFLIASILCYFSNVYSQELNEVKMLGIDKELGIKILSVNTSYSLFKKDNNSITYKSKLNTGLDKFSVFSFNKYDKCERIDNILPNIYKPKFIDAMNQNLSFKKVDQSTWICEAENLQVTIVDDKDVLDICYVELN